MGIMGHQRLTQLAIEIKYLYFGSDASPVKCDIIPVIIKRYREKFCGSYFQGTSIEKRTGTQGEKKKRKKPLEQEI